MRSIKKIIVYLKLTLVFAILLPSFIQAKELKLTIIHTNDLHSHMMSFSPSMDYTYEKNDDKTLGGIARIATVIENIKSKSKNPVLILDAGDFMMGTMFHTLAPNKVFELKIMKMMGYDMLTLGNHEFDMTPDILAKILNVAKKGDFLPPVVLSNFIFSHKDKRDDSLHEAYQKGLIKQYRVKELNGFKIGFFGILGKDAAFKSRYADPIKFRDPVATAKNMVRLLKEKEGVDLVICLSHSGLKRKGKDSEDEELARNVPGIDVIISGHSHTQTDKPLRINNTIIVQAGYYGRSVGVLDLTKKEDLKVTSYSQVKIDDTIQSDLAVLREIGDFRDEIDRSFFKKHGFESRKIVGETRFDLLKEAKECSLGNLLSDSIKWYVNKHSYNKDNPDTKVVVSIVAHGTVRDPLIKGKTGKLSVGEIFKTVPMGIGKDLTMGYPLVSFYIYPHELKKGLEIITSLRPILGDSFFLHVSGLKFKYNPNRMIFDKISQIHLGNEKTGYTLFDYSKSRKNLVRVATNIYVAGFLKDVGRKTYDVLKIVPKDRAGIPIKSLSDIIVDADKNKDGVQELKEWKAPIAYIASFKDTDGNTIPDIPLSYKKKRGIITIENSVNPLDLIKNGTIITWISFLCVLGSFLIIILFAGYIMRKIYPDKFKKS
jgi:5'-nucleotidase